MILVDRTDKGTFWTHWSQSELARDLDQIALPMTFAPRTSVSRTKSAAQACRYRSSDIPPFAKPKIDRSMYFIDGTIQRTAGRAPLCRLASSLLVI
jgi:hypothetical protein